MKKYNFLALLFIPILIFSCNKKDETTLPNTLSTQKQQQNTAQSLAKAKGIISEFNEKNSKKMSWSQLPAQLRNAKRLDNLKQQPQKGKKGQTLNGEAQTSAISYYYYVGPWGGTGGSPYYIYPTLDGSRIIAIAVRSGDFVDAITIWYMDFYGNVYMGGSVGGTGGDFYLSFFDADEYIWAVGGQSGDYLDHLYIWTNKKTLSYGGTGGYYFEYVIPSDYYQVLGIFGGSGDYIDRIGFYIYSRW